jgi:hypothetical protein
MKVEREPVIEAAFRKSWAGDGEGWTISSSIGDVALKALCCDLNWSDSKGLVVKGMTVKIMAFKIAWS